MMLHGQRPDGAADESRRLVESPHSSKPGAKTTEAKGSGNLVPERSAQSNAEGVALRGQGRVLVVDDEPSVARLTGLVLNQHGFDVEVAVSGRGALEVIERTPDRFRLILVDLSMPDLSGVEVLERARALGCPAPVVLTSGYSKNETAQVVGSADFAGYLQKPYRLEALLDVIEAALA